ncbi:ribonuclease III [Erythrobacter sp.]|jgi:ribonuclease III|uniref:ribonuclease III n=1 Tax=Erythrobacteraceae TaxID=335929 RepID=UPI001B2073C3|nr:ribonuclease III [Erythrobacter sp.]MBO6525900.1 ribonuclease III [Erythrobacter sp.]MBO6529425.1 ribonuclease III [Erythrobacter sp.]MBO6769591.1 ribonuclease III [Erythrobacter sp.]
MSALAPETREWLAENGFTVRDEARWFAALTHGSMGERQDYERLEFLGDRVLGLSIADWLYAQSGAPEGKLAQRLNAIVSRQMCAQIARGIGLPPHVRISRQASSDGGRDSDNILGDVMEALLGAEFLDNGFDASRKLVHLLWRPALESGAGKSKHPKSALQEWAAGNQRKPPEYELVERSGPDHAARFTVRVKVHKVGEAKGTANSKQEAEKQAAREFMEKFG